MAHGTRAGARRNPASAPKPIVHRSKFNGHWQFRTRTKRIDIANEQRTLNDEQFSPIPAFRLHLADSD